MARKTNKTAHVLNLLSTGNPTIEEPDQPDKQALAPNISIVEDPKSSGDPLANLIKESLDKEIIAAQIAPKAPEPEPVPIVSEPEPTAPEPEPAPIISEPEPTAPEPEPAPIILEPEPTAPEPEPAPIISEPEPTAPEPEPTPIISEPEPPAYRYVNMMDIVVEERLLEFINRFDVCTCDRCVKDVKALTLNNLPPKYLVVPIASIAPLTSFYRNKYNIYAITELTKACLAVLENPRH